MAPAGPESEPRRIARFHARVLESPDAAAVARELERTASEPEGVGIMTRKGRSLLVRLDHVPLKAAPLLKQEMLAVGGDSAHARGIADHSVSESPVVLVGTPAQYTRLFEKLERQPFQLREIGVAVAGALAAYQSTAPRESIRGLHRTIPLGGRTRVMGVVNVTPDSFSDGGQFMDPDAAMARVAGLAVEGCDLVDLGAESTRPGAGEISIEEEWKRLEPVLRKCHDAGSLPISVDTRHAEVARRALGAGADLINDVGGMRDPEMRRVVARAGAPIIVMHMRGTPATMQLDTDYADLRGEVFSSLADSLAQAVDEGIPREKILVDPGLGFGKTGKQNLELLLHLGELRSLGSPIVLGASRKKFLGEALGDAPLVDRLEPGLAAAVIAAMAGAAYVRTHDVGPTVRALRLANAVRAGSFGVTDLMGSE